ncbi:MAG: outer membrane protein assembly factor BamE [Thiohalobacterales bacterium]|nr:outer membrane protein assembly factor BamE [Thiohalobacterales bacterium]
MKKLLTIITCIASLYLPGCSITEWSLVHRIDIQQGNVITQEAVNQLEPGMSRRQVQYVVGSPMVADVFHQDRWDYIYHLKKGNGEIATEHVSLFFENDVLARISGTIRPQDSTEAGDEDYGQVTLVVPPQERVPPGLLTRLWRWVTFQGSGDDQP